jgi:cytochrome b
MTDKSQKKIRVWDLPVRLFHWTLVVLMVVSYFTGRWGGDWMKFHFWSGYTILTLILFRIAWGFIGSTTCRFSHFIRGPAACVAHLRELLGPHAPRDVGHNAVGGLMVVALLLAVLVQVTAGLFSGDTDTGMVNGPLSGLIADKWVDRFTDLHKFWVNVLLVLVGLHVVAAFAYLFWKKQNLILAMISGHKPLGDAVPPGAPPPSLAFAPTRLAVSVLIVCGAIVYFIVR